MQLFVRLRNLMIHFALIVPNATRVSHKHALVPAAEKFFLFRKLKYEFLKGFFYQLTSGYVILYSNIACACTQSYCVVQLTVLYAEYSLHSRVT